MLKYIGAILLIQVIFSLPYPDQMTLANSLIVGKDDLSDLINWQCKVCNPSNKPLHAHFIEQKAKDVKCILSVYNSFVVLAFRYTNTALNVWQDILYPLQIVDQHTCSKCKVQKAYNNMWEQIKDDVINDLKLIKTQTKIDTLYITGISLGGGLASISYIDVNHANVFSTVKITTYGAPRVGNTAWADHFNAIAPGSLRYIVKGDPITVLPECLTLLCSYKHTGIQIVCQEQLQQCRQRVVQDRSYLQKLKTGIQIRANPKKVQGLIDHIDGYPKIYNFTLMLGSES